MTAYYNEFDAKTAAWLRELIRRGLIAPGDVDERSILDVTPGDLRGYTQCHFFAGIGGRSYALRLAGWSDEQPVWTGSPPCQPFSNAGQQKGKEDERHLSPHFAELVAALRPPILFGEQVASAQVFGKAAKRAKPDAESAPEWAWFDDLSARLERAHYAVAASDIAAASVGTPHIRQRCFFGAVALGFGESRLGDTSGEPRKRHAPEGGGPESQTRDEAWLRGFERGRGRCGLANAVEQRGCRRGIQRPGESDRSGHRPPCQRSARLRANGRLAHSKTDRRGQECPDLRRGDVRNCSEGRAPGFGPGCSGDGLANASDTERGPVSVDRENGCFGAHERRTETHREPGARDEVHGVAHSHGASPSRQQRLQPENRGHERQGGGGPQSDAHDRPATDEIDSPWAVVDWLFCRDAKWRPVEPGTFPLADGVPARVVRLRGYGNAIVPQAAAQFIQAFIQAQTQTVNGAPDA